MPFGHDDCDVLYEKKIYPTLKSLNIVPIRVDQREHREDLNVYIIRMLDESDIALVDLTYARPSVYYEAGYAERKIPVAYTARVDHLNRAQGDDRLRVHFDLEMKKIISWKSAEDISFPTRLRRRIQYLILPLTQQIQRGELLEKSHRAFVSKSVKARIEEIARKFQTGLKAKRFWTASLWDIDKMIATNFLPGQVIVAGKMVGGTCHFCAVIIEDSLTKKTIQYAVNGPLPLSVTHAREIDEYKEYFFLCAIQKYQMAHITSVLPDAIPIKPPGTFAFHDTPPFSWGKKTEKIVRVMPSIDSFIVLRDYLKTCQSTLPFERTNRYTYLDKTSGRINRIRFNNKPQPD